VTNPAQQLQQQRQQEQQQAEARKREAVQQVLSKTQRALQEFYGKVTTELGEEQEKEVALQAHRKEVLASLTTLKKKKEEVEERVRRVMEMDGGLEKWMAEQASRPVVAVDDLVEAADPPSRQMLELVAQNAAIEDALYHIDKALANNSVDLLVFLKKVRELSREQFMCVAHVNKIYRAQQAALVAARAAPQGGGGGGRVTYPSIPPAVSR
jgi:ESCRT-I complex subunit TSG101